MRAGWNQGGNFDENASYPNWDFVDGQKHSSGGHTMNLLSQGLMKMPSMPKKKEARGAKL